MAFVSIPSDDIATGKPTKQELFQTIKDNFDDHESRLTTVEGSVGSFFPIEFLVNGRITSRGTQSEILTQRIPFNINILGARLQILDDITTGTLEVDLRTGATEPGATSIFSTRPSLSSTDSKYDVSTNQILSTTTLNATELLILDTTIVPTTMGERGYVVILEYELT